MGREKSALRVWKLIACAYFSYKYVYDDFDIDHTARRRWRGGYDSTPGGKTYLDENAFRRNALGRVQTIMPLLLDAYSGSDKEYLAALAQRITTLDINAYDQMPVSDKRQAVQKIKDTIYDITVSLAKHYTN